MKQTEQTNIFPPAFIVTGTDTNVGKTIVSAMLTIGLQAAYWKPVQSGLAPHSDSQFIRELCAPDPEIKILPEAYCLTQPLSPHLSARLDGIYIDPASIVLPKWSAKKHLIIEGAGGVLVPLNEKYLQIDLFKQLALPVILVCRSSLGTINHTLLTLEALAKKNIPVFGIIMCGSPNKENRLAIESFGQVPVIAEMPWLESLTYQSLLDCFNSCFNKSITTSSTK